MPGTFGTLLGIPVAWLLARALSPIGYMVAALALMGFAIGVAELYEREFGKHDSQEIVIDEVVGYVIAMTWLPLTWQSFVYAFIAFRFFDILKPGPIRAIDRRVKGGFGTILDDVAAGLAASVVMQLIAAETNWLGGIYAV